MRFDTRFVRKRLAFFPLWSIYIIARPNPKMKTNTYTHTCTHMHTSLSLSLSLSLSGTYLGATVMTLCPLFASSTGRPPTTSPRPPVLLHGATSAETKTISKGVCGSSTAAGEVGALVDASGAIARSFATLVFFCKEEQTKEPARALDVQTLWCCLRCCLAWTDT